MKRYKMVLLTGASSGIGKEIAYSIAPQAEKMVLVSRREELLAAIANDLNLRFGCDAFALPFDLSSPGAAEKVFERAMELAGRPPDLLVNAAGVGFCGDASEIPLDLDLRMLSLNVEVPLALCKLALKTMYARRKGVILNVSSVGGFLPGPFMASYYASKAFLLSYSEALAEEARPHGVRVLTLCPGTVDTEFFDKAGASKGFFRRHFSSSPQAVASAAVGAILRGFPDRIVPGCVNRAILVFERLMPHRFIVSLAAKFLKPSKTRGDAK